MNNTYNEVNKKKSSILNTITALFLVIIQGVLTFLLSRQIIKYLGSDYHGLNATVNQFMGLLLVLEGGITLASTVASFKPLTDGNNEMVNNILYKSNKQLQKFSTIMLLIGFPLAIGYSFVVISDANIFEIIIALLIGLITAFITIGVNTKYRIIYQSTNKEYILNTVKIITILVTRIFVLILLSKNLSFILFQIILAFSVFFEWILYKLFFKINFKSFCFTKSTNDVAIKGTKDFYAQKITNMLYTSIPMLLISSVVGTLASSIYYIYKSIFGLVKNISISFINAPKNALGLLISKEGVDKVKDTYMRYQFGVITISLYLLTIASIVTLPFIKMFYVGAGEEYLSTTILTMVLITTTLELLHIPSGILINIDSRFKEGKNIQIIASIVLIIGLLFGSLFYGLKGILFAVLLAAFVLALLEILYVHKDIVKNKTVELLKTTVINIMIMLTLILIGTSIRLEFTSFFNFLFQTIIIAIFTGGVFLTVNTLFNFKYVVYYFNFVFRVKKSITKDK